MNEKRWVQHISGQGEKWEVVKEWEDGWYVKNDRKSSVYFVPSSEYIPCPPPERWVDVTEQCETGVIYTGVSIGTKHITGSVVDGYRLRKVERHIGMNCPIQWAFLIEKKEPA